MQELHDSSLYKIFRGCFEYSLDGNVYAEENFDIYKDKKDNSLRFISELLSRMATGEVFKVETFYHASHDGVAIRGEVKKNLGNEWATETFKNDSRKNIVLYEFKSKMESKDVSITTAPRLHIQMPVMSCAFHFMKTKKLEQTGKTMFGVLQSYNQWRFESEPKIIPLTIQREGLDTVNLKLNDNNVAAMVYWLNKMSDDEKSKSNSGKPIAESRGLKVYMSKHLNIPYLVDDTATNTQIRIKFLNNLDPDA